MRLPSPSFLSLLHQMGWDGKEMKGKETKGSEKKKRMTVGRQFAVAANKIK